MYLLAWMMSAQAQVAQGIPVTVVVQDSEGAPVVSAQIRHPDETTKHRVNTEDGSWTAEAVYLQGGVELVFQKKMEVPLEISAPGFINQAISVVVSKKAKKNRFVVQLERLDIDMEHAGSDGGPSIGFKHDKPRD